MNGLLLSAPEATKSDDGTSELSEAQSLLKQMVLDSVTSPNTRRSYAKTLDELFAFSAGRPLTRALLQEGKATMKRERSSQMGGGLPVFRSFAANATTSIRRESWIA